MDTHEALAAVARTISHDAKAPLRAIETFAGFLGEDLGPEAPARAAEDLKRIQAAATRLRGLLDDLVRIAQEALEPSTERSESRPDPKNLG
jgi:light-regulated signal transduction histidine kinase (bacteriophytochrome)